MVGITREGLVIKSYEDIVEDISESYRRVWGDSFDTTPESPDGHNIRIIARFLSDFYQLLPKAYHAYNLNAVEGVGLDNLIRLGNMFRLRDQATSVVIEVQSMSGLNNGVTLPKGTQVETIDNIIFTTDSDLVVPGSVLTTCTTTGPIPIGVGEVVKLLSNDMGGDLFVENHFQGVTGIDEEIDSAVVSRYNRRMFRNARNLKEAIYSALSDLNLEFISIIENDTQEEKDGIPPNSFLVVTEGSTPQLIAERIESRKPLGIRAVGDIEVTVYDSEGIAEVIGLSRPIQVEIQVRVSVFRPSTIALSNIRTIKNNILEKVNSTRIATDLYWAGLFAPATSVNRNIDVRGIEISRDGGVTWLQENITISNRERAITNFDLIEVVEELV